MADEKKALHWADKYAEQIIARNPEKKEYIVESGITPSGTVHAGNFRETMTQELVYKALLDKGVKARYIYYWDDYDRFRKVPKGVPKEWEQYIGMPLFKVPDPHGCHDNYAEHHEAPVQQENEAVGIHVEYLHSSKEYPKGIYADYLKTALENNDKIREILNKFRKEPLPENWLCVEVYCEKCWRDKTTAKYEGGYEVSYKCNYCGHEGRINFQKGGRVKLRWRSDWPMRWAYYGVDFESSGKEHKAAGGSWDTGIRIMKEVFKKEPPIGPMYEFIYFKGQKEKMSSSTGNVIKVRQLLEVYEPEVVRYLYTAKINKSFEISFDADLLNDYNYFDKAKKMYYGKIEEKDENEIRKYELAKLTDEYVDLPQFSVCVNAIQIALGDIEKAREILKKTGHPYEHADKRLQLAWNWVQKYAPEQFKFTVKQNLKEIAEDIRLNTWSDEMKELLKETADEIEKGATGEELQQFIFNTAKAKEIPVKIAFMTFYQLLLGKSRGPKLGPFLASLDKDFAVKRLRLEA